MNTYSKNENDIEDDVRNSDEMEQASEIKSTKSLCAKKEKSLKLKLKLIINYFQIPLFSSILKDNLHRSRRTVK